MGRAEFPDLNFDYERALVGYGTFQLERNGALFGVHGLVRSKKRLTPPTLLERPVYVSNLSGSTPQRTLALTASPRRATIGAAFVANPSFLGLSSSAVSGTENSTQQALGTVQNDWFLCAGLWEFDANRKSSCAALSVPSARFLLRSPTLAIFRPRRMAR